MPNPQDKVGLLILAAGASTRLGRPKQLLPYRGTNLIVHTVLAGLESQCQPIVVVVGASSQLVAEAISHFPLTIVKNDHWNLGMSSSIWTGITKLMELDQGLSGVIITTCDQPHVAAKTIDDLIALQRTSGKPVIASAYSDTLGVPAFFQRDLFGELSNLLNVDGVNVDGANVDGAGVGGAKKLINKYAKSSQVATLDFAPGAVDIDTEADYALLKAD